MLNVPWLQVYVVGILICISAACAQADPGPCPLRTELDPSLARQPATTVRERPEDSIEKATAKPGASVSVGSDGTLHLIHVFAASDEYYARVDIWLREEADGTPRAEGHASTCERSSLVEWPLHALEGTVWLSGPLYGSEEAAPLTVSYAVQGMTGMDVRHPMGTLRLPASRTR